MNARAPESVIATPNPGVDKGWTQKAEGEFLRMIGTHSECGMARAELLEKYIKACELRKRWVGIDGKRMKAYAERLLAELKNVKEVV